MKKTLETTATVVILAAVIAGAMWLGDSLSIKKYRNYHHECIDTTHATCDGECECDGMDCQ